MSRTLIRLILLFLLLGNISKAQSPNIGHIRFQRSTDSTNYLYDKLKIRDTNTVIIVISWIGLNTNGQYTDSFLFYPNGKLKIIEQFTSYNKNKCRSYSKKYKIRNSCKDSLLEIIQNNDFDFNRDSLAIVPESIITDSTITIINTWDGLRYSVAVVKGNQYLEYSTQSPESIIKAKRDGWIEKQKFLELIKSLEKIKNCNLK